MVYALAIVEAVAVLTPVLMVCLRLTWLAVHVVPEVDAEPNGDDRDYERRYRQFAELGFQPAGATRETCWFISPFDWYWRSHDHHRWMATPDGEALVVLYRLVAVEPVRFSIKTVFDGGAVVSTCCPGAGLRSDTATHLHVEYQNLEPADLVAKHREHAEAFAQKHSRRITPCTVAEAAKAEIVHDRDLLQSRPLRRRGVPDALIVLAAPTLLAFQFLPLDGSALHRGAIAFVVGATVFAAVRLFYLPKVVAQNALKAHAPTAATPPPPAGIGGAP